MIRGVEQSPPSVCPPSRFARNFVGGFGFELCPLKFAFVEVSFVRFSFHRLLAFRASCPVTLHQGCKVKGITRGLLAV